MGLRLSDLTTSPFIHWVHHPKRTDLKFIIHAMSSSGTRYKISLLFCSFLGSFFNEHTALGLGDFLLTIVLVRPCWESHYQKNVICMCRGTELETKTSLRQSSSLGDFRVVSLVHGRFPTDCVPLALFSSVQGSWQSSIFISIYE